MPESPSDYRTARRLAVMRRKVEAVVEELEQQGADIKKRIAEVEAKRER